MNADYLIKEIGFIDDEWIEEAAEWGRAKRKWRPIAAACAAAVVVLVCWAAVMKGRDNTMSFYPEPTIDEAPPQSGEEHIHGAVPQEPDSTCPDYSLIINDASAQVARHCWPFMTFTEKLTDQQLCEVLPGLYGEGEMDATAVYSEDGQLLRVIADFVDGEGISAQIELSEQEIVHDYLFDFEPYSSDIDGCEVVAGRYETTLFASFAIDNINYYVSLEGDEADLGIVLSKIINGGDAEIDALVPSHIPELRNDELDMDMAYADPDYGKYLPMVEINGLEFEHGVRYIDQHSDRLTVLWSQWETQGYDQLYVTISRLTEDDRVRVVSPEEKERYDLALYPIPRADSVPEELWEVVDDPIFPIEELTVEQVYARAYILDEAGDSDGHRMRFSVLCGNILLSFDSKGQTPEDIYDMIINIAND